MSPACPRENCPLKPLISWRLTASTMLKPTSITIRRLYGSILCSTTRVSRAARTTAATTGALLQSVPHHAPPAAAPPPPAAAREPVATAPPPGGGGGATSTPDALSDPLDAILEEQPRGFDE